MQCNDLQGFAARLETDSIKRVDYLHSNAWSSSVYVALQMARSVENELRIFVPAPPRPACSNECMTMPMALTKPDIARDI